MQIGWRQLDLHPALVLVPSVHALEQRDVVVERKLEPVVPALHRSAQLRRQAGDERRVVLIHQPVLVAHREGIRHPHADILVGADHLVCTRVHLGQLARHPAMDVLHRRDAGGDHLERRIQRVEIHVQIAGHHAGDEPQLQRHVRRTKLHGRQADMVMTVDEARQQDLVAGADHRHGRMLAGQIGEGADRGDRRRPPGARHHPRSRPSYGDPSARVIIARLRISDAGMPIYLLGWRHPLPNPPPLRGRGVLRPFSRAAGEGWGGGARFTPPQSPPARRTRDPPRPAAAASVRVAAPPPRARTDPAAASGPPARPSSPAPDAR